MLAVARRRAAELGLGSIHCAVADMESLPFGDASFDAVTCRFGLMFTTDRDAAVDEASRVLRPGARAVYVVWGPVEDNTANLVSEPVVRRHFGIPDPDAPSKRHSLGAPGTMTGILEGAGFRQVEERPLRDEHKNPVSRHFWRSRLKRSFAPQYAAMNEAEIAALDEKIAAAFEPHRDGNFYLIRSLAWLTVATRR